MDKTGNLRSATVDSARVALHVTRRCSKLISRCRHDAVERGRTAVEQEREKTYALVERYQEVKRESLRLRAEADEACGVEALDG